MRQRMAAEGLARLPRRAGRGARRGRLRGDDRPAQMRALITGIGGMDGSHLADLLLDRGYEVWGLQRRSARGESPNLAHLRGRVKLLAGDMTDGPSLDAAVARASPHEVYNLAAQSFVGASWE